jgi:hypothetical protein
MVDPIMVQLAQGIARPLFSVVLGVEVFCKGIQFFENFTLCDFDNFDAILRKTCLDTYKIHIFYNGGKLKVHAKSGSKLVNLDVDYNFALVKMGVNLVVLANEL